MNSTESKVLFQQRFAKDPAIHSTPVYEIYIDGARKLWDKYSCKYDLRPQRDPKKGNNRGVIFYEDTTSRARLIYISIGKTTTLYVYDKKLLPLFNVEYECDNRGNFRYPKSPEKKSFDEIMEVIDGIL